MSDSRRFEDRSPDQRKRDRDHEERMESATESLPVLLLAAFPLLFWMLSGSFGAIVAALFHFTLLAIAAALISSGHDAARRYDAAEAAARPKVPKKILGCVLLGVMVFLLAASQVHTWLPPIFFGLAATGFGLAAFGPDPLRDKGLDSPEYLARLQVDRILTKADSDLRAIVDRVDALGDRALTHRTEAMHGTILRLLRTFSTAPHRLFGLRRPLAKYIELAEAETAKLEADWAATPERAAARYATRLQALADAFEAGARARRQKETPDAYAFDADLLAERMRDKKAA